MDYAVALSRANQGLDAPLVRVEVHLSNGLPAFTVVGMPETTVRESKDRVRSALLNSHFEFPDRRITVNLAPADLPKGGGRFDLPIALGILCASGQLPADTLLGTECFGELALDGSLREVRGLVAATLAATSAGRRAVVPRDAAGRCLQVPDARLCHADDLLTLCAILRGRVEADPVEAPSGTVCAATRDLRVVRGQPLARRALEIAAAGRHHLLLSGPPGTGKSLLASCLPGILAPARNGEGLEIAALHDLHDDSCPPGSRPFRAPHHSASAAALIGGGSVPRPGEASLAHGGVLFLDELPEFSRHALDMLREPLETGEITLARASARLRYPARFQLIAAMNPCPCGHAGDPKRHCRCSPAQRSAYASRVSGPLLDRIDLRVVVSREDTGDLFTADEGEGSDAVRARVQACDERQRSRQGKANSALEAAELLAVCDLQDAQRDLLRSAMTRLQLSGRAVHRVLRVARTIADLAGEAAVTQEALHEALAYRLDGPAPP